MNDPIQDNPFAINWLEPLWVNGIPIHGSTLVDSVYQFNRLGQVTPPGHFNANRVGFYTGMQLEEMAEKVEAIAAGVVDARDRARMEIFAAVMDAWATEFKAGQHQGAVLRADREKLLDSDVDQSVVTLGSMQYQTPKFVPAIGSVLSANAHKGDGGFKHDANGKILKPDGWIAPDLRPFVDHYGE